MPSSHLPACLQVAPASQIAPQIVVYCVPIHESFGVGGTIARYAAEGTDVWLVCATDGDAGTVDAALLDGYANTSQLRAAELCCAAQALGLKGIDWLGYRDSGMAGSSDNQNPASLVQAPMDKLVGEIVASIRRHQPQVVICDNEFGGYGHPDHIKLHQATVLAFEAAADPARYPEAGPPHRPERLYFTTISLGFVKYMVRLLPLIGRDPRKFGHNKDIDLLQNLKWETPINARIDVQRYYDVKQAASACHVSQGGGANGGIPAFLARRISRFDVFTRGFPAPAAGQPMDTDLFA